MSRDVCNQCLQLLTSGAIPLAKDQVVWFCKASGVGEVIFIQFNPSKSCIKAFEHAVAEGIQDVK